MKRTIWIVCGVLLWSAAASAQVKRVPPPWTLPAGESLVYEGATNDGFETTLAVTDPTADRTITFPNATGTVALTAAPVFTTSIEISAAAPLFTLTDTTAGEDDFSFEIDADIFNFKSGATILWQGFGATHASAGQMLFGSSISVQPAVGRITLTSTTGTSNTLIDIVNSGTNVYVGQEGSVGGTTFADSLAYAAVFGHTAGRALHLATSNAVRATIDSAGDFGIGTTAPRYKSTTIGVLSSLLSDDGTNYEGLTITPASGSVTFAMVEGGTGSDNGDIKFSPIGTGDLWLTLGDLNIDTDAGVLNFGAAQDNAIGRAAANSLYASKGFHVGGTSDAGDNNLLVDGEITANAIWGPTSLGYFDLYGDIGASKGLRLYDTGLLSIAGSLEVAGANAQAAGIKYLTELTTINAAATTDTAIQIPANAIVVGVSVRVTTVIPTAVTFTVTGATSATAFQTGASVSTAADTTDVGTKACPYLNTAAQSIRITPNVQPADNTGRVRITIHYFEVTAPTS